MYLEVDHHVIGALSMTQLNLYRKLVVIYMIVYLE